MKISDVLGPLRHVVQESPLPVSPESTLERVVRHVPTVSVSAPALKLMKSGAAAGATVVALSAVSAATSAVRRKQGGS